MSVSDALLLLAAASSLAVLPRGLVWAVEGRLRAWARPAHADQQWMGLFGCANSKAAVAGPCGAPPAYIQKTSLSLSPRVSLSLRVCVCLRGLGLGLVRACMLFLVTP
jgi:hypothetical protein